MVKASHLIILSLATALSLVGLLLTLQHHGTALQFWTDLALVIGLGLGLGWQLWKWLVEPSAERMSLLAAQTVGAELSTTRPDVAAASFCQTMTLFEQEQSLQTVLDAFPLSVFWKDRQSVYRGGNRRFLRDAGLQTTAELVGKTDYDLPWRLYETEVYRADDAEVIASGMAKLHIVETQLQSDGSSCWVETNKLPLRNPQGEVIGVLGTYQDITARKRAELALQQSENRLRLITDSVRACISYIDAAQRYRFVNSTYEIWFGRPKASIVGCTIAQIIGPAAYQRFIERALAGETVTYEMNMPYIMGESRYISAVLVPDITTTGEVRGYYSLIHDISDLKQIQERLAHNALHDSLTNLPNRRLLTERIGLALQSARQRATYTYAVLFLDVDRFKVVNDSLGHAAGDQLLQAIASRLRQLVPPKDCVGRLGGDEFVILLEDIQSSEVALQLVQRILAEAQEPVVINGCEVFTGFSIGVVFGSASYEHPSHVIRNADIAMYRAKALGGNSYRIFDAAMHDQVIKRLNLETALRKAIVHREFEVHYQPIIDLRDQRLVRLEALARMAPHWRRQSINPQVPEA